MTVETTSPHATSFLFSKENPPPDGFFQGYCFAGTDYVYSHEGKDQYEAETGKAITGGLDGCYGLVRREGDGFVFSNDFSGYKTLFYYHDGDNWVVSNSFAQTVDHLRHEGVPITPNYAQLAAIHAKGSSASQLFSFETIVRDVQLLPRATDLIVTPSRGLIRRRPSVPELDYTTGLREHLDLWIGRFETLLLNGRVGLTADLTGGVDSRTNFGLLSMAKHRLGGEGTDPRLNCGSTPDSMKDLEVATQLTEHFGMPLNDERVFPRYNLSPTEAFNTFRNLQAGVAYTLFMPSEAPTPYKVSIGGGGGEIHRKFYESQRVKAYDSKAFIRMMGSRLKYPWLRQDFIRQGRASLDFATVPGKDPLRTHYREFRHRFHVGRAPRYGVLFTPLDSMTADIAQSRAGQARLDNGQFNYDIIASLSKDLLDLPYDEPYKAPSDDVRASLTTVDVPQDARPGKVWAPESLHVINQRSSAKRSEVLRDAVENALNDPFVSSFWGNDTAVKARELLDRLVTGKGIGNARNGKPISALLAAHIASPTP